MTQKTIIARFEYLINELHSNFHKYDSQLLEQFVDEIFQRLSQCYHIDPEILAFLQDKKYFKSMRESKTFVKALTGTCSSKSRVKDASTENAHILIGQGFTIDQLRLKLKLKPEPEKVDSDVLTFLQDKKNFKLMRDLQTFIQEILGTYISKRSRKETEIENAKLLINKGVTIEQLRSKLSAGLTLVTKIKEPPRKSSPPKAIKDMGPMWLRLNEAELKKEFAKYSNLSDLKKAASSILRSTDKLLNSRPRVVERILERIREKKALFRLGQ